MSEQENAMINPAGDIASGPAEDTSKQEELEAVAKPDEEGREQDEAGEPAQATEPAAEVTPVSVSRDDVGPEAQEEPPAEEDPLEQAREENKKLREQMLRLAADFDNFRKRARRENEDSARRSKIDVLRELLPVFDNMGRAVAHAEQATDAKAVATGVEMVVKQFLDIVGKLGVERVKSVGEVFDPNIHEAIQQIETADQSPGTVVAELLPGYVWGDRLLRASMVVVAKAPPEPEPEPQSDGTGIVIDAEVVEESPEDAGTSSATSEDTREDTGKQSDSSG